MGKRERGGYIRTPASQNEAYDESSRQTASAQASLPAEQASQCAAAACARPAATSSGAGELYDAVPVRTPVGPMVWKHDVLRKNEQGKVIQSFADTRNP